ncbi:MAG: PH domain-containing protein, partial [Glaciihabitans sp.]
MTAADQVPEAPRPETTPAESPRAVAPDVHADPAAAVLPPSGSGLADGQWHHLHPATPLLRGGIALIAILGIVINSVRERLIESFVGGGYSGEYGSGDPIDWIMDEGYIGLALGITAVGLILFIGGFYLSWRMHTFRITEELVEVRSGILFRTHRRGRLDRIQGINIVRPFIA